MPVDYGNVTDTLHGKPGYAVRHEHAVLKRLADLAVRRYEALPPKVAARTPIQEYVSQEVMNLLGTLSHHNVENEKIARSEAKKAIAEARAIQTPSSGTGGSDISSSIPNLSPDSDAVVEAPKPTMASILTDKRAKTAADLSAEQTIGMSAPDLRKSIGQLKEMVDPRYGDYNVDPELLGKNPSQLRVVLKKYQNIYQQQQPVDLSNPFDPLAIQASKRETLRKAKAAAKSMAENFDWSAYLKAPTKPVATTSTTVTDPFAGFLKAPTKPVATTSTTVADPFAGFLKAPTKPVATTSTTVADPFAAYLKAPTKPVATTSTTVADPFAAFLTPTLKKSPYQNNFDEEDPMVFAALKDNYKIGQDEIRATFGKNRKDRDIFFNQLHGVGKSSLTQASEIGNYLSDKHQDMSKAIIDEMTENYLDNILPKANVGFMGGAWNTPQRSTHQERVLRNLHKDVSRNLAHMHGRAHEKGLEEAGQQQTRQLYASQAAHDILNKQQQSAATASDILASVEGKKLGSDMLKLELARNVGAEEQAQAGQKLEEVQRHALRQQEHPFEMAERELAALRGVAPQSMSTMHLMQQNPNYAAIGAGGLGNMAAAMFTGHGQNQMKKSGGLIQKYAPGGMVTSNIEKDPETLLMEQEAQSLLNAPYDQRQAVLHGVARMGDKIAERYTGMPGIAGDFIDTQMAHKNAHDVQRVRGLNLMQQVQASRVKQQNFLAELEFKNKHHSETLGETSRHNKAMERLQESRVAQSGGPGFSGPGGGSITDRKAAREAVAALRKSKSMKRELSTLSELSSKIETGPVKGLLNYGYLKSEDANKMEVGANKLILDMHQGMKNIPRSEEFMKRIESTKPNVNNYPEANEMALKMMAEGVDDIEKNSIDTLLSAGYTMEDIQHILQQEQVAPSSSGSSQLQMIKAARATKG